MTQTTKKKPKTGDPHPGGGVYMCKADLRHARKAIKASVIPGTKVGPIVKHPGYPQFYDVWVEHPDKESQWITFVRMCERLTYQGCYEFHSI